MNSFPDRFIWGVSTSAYQIEGAWNEDGRGPSIWDAFSHTHGKTHAGENGDQAVDHYHRWKEDFKIIAGLGVKAYRFSISWPRVLPQGKGHVNPAGLDFYSRQVDALLEAGITPFPTLFHYDLPLPFQAGGGWTNRATCDYFSDYAALIGRHLGDRVNQIITHNEPWITAVLGHLLGSHAPGWHNPGATLAALHHLLLSHGMAVQALRASAPKPLSIGIALNLTPIYPAVPVRDGPAVRQMDSLFNRIVLDPLLKGQYPSDLTQSWVWRLLERSIRHPGGRGIPDQDLALISQPLDFIGVNYYTRTVVRKVPVLQAVPVQPVQGNFSQMWEIYPEGLYDLLVRLNEDYHHPNLIITENGVPVADAVTPDGEIHDLERISYLEAHIRQVQRALQAGVPVKGYFVWSLLDNFEWALGYARRFGLVHVDFATQQRRLKDSARWFTQVIQQNGIESAHENY